MTDPNRLRGIFGEDAELYDRCRPGYPPEVVADLASLAGPGARVLEIGCGTGQATLPMTRLGWAVTGVELDANMAAVARRNAPDADVVVSAFEGWESPATPFDLVVAATAFHWVDPEVRVVKAADVLRPGGSLVVISTHHVLGGTEEFFAAAQRCYERFDPDTPPDLRLEPSSAIPEDSAEFDDSGRFGPVSFRRHEWELTYTAAGYLDLLSTYSGHRALPADARDGLFRCIADLIDDRPGGRITKRFMTQLAITARGSR